LEPPPGYGSTAIGTTPGLVTDLVACEDAHESERVGVQPLGDSAQRGQLWMADPQFCTEGILQGLSQAQASLVVREHARHPPLIAEHPWVARSRIETGWLREQCIEVQDFHGGASQDAASTWRRIEIELDTPTEAGETRVTLWTNLPTAIDAATMAALYRKRWRIKGMSSAATKAC
jgi:IS4 transposase